MFHVLCLYLSLPLLFSFGHLRLSHNKERPPPKVHRPKRTVCSLLFNFMSNKCSIIFFFCCMLHSAYSTPCMLSYACIYTEHQQKLYHFVRETFTKIQSIKINLIGHRLGIVLLTKHISKKQNVSLSKKKKKKSKIR